MKDESLRGEKEFLDEVYSTYRISGSPQNRVIRELIMRTFDPFIRKDGEGAGLELGYADGYETEMLANRLRCLDVLEGSEKFCMDARRDMPNITIIHTLFEEYRPEENIRYDYIFANYVLEHVLNDEVIIRMIKDVIKPDGLLFVTVPNARAFSRQLALRMKLIDGLYNLTENDKAHGHRRVYDRVLLNDLLDRNGFATISEGGIMFKILADFQLDILMNQSILTKAHIDGLYELGLQYPDLAGSIYSVCRPRISE